MACGKPGSFKAMTPLSPSSPKCCGHRPESLYRGEPESPSKHSQVATRRRRYTPKKDSGADGARKGEACSRKTGSSVRLPSADGRRRLGSFTGGLVTASAARRPGTGSSWRDARRIRQVGESLPTPRAVGEAGLVGAYSPSVRRERSPGTGDEGA